MRSRVFRTCLIRKPIYPCTLTFSIGTTSYCASNSINSSDSARDSPAAQAGPQNLRVRKCSFLTTPQIKARRAARIMVAMHSESEIAAALQKYWGYDSFRPLQEKIVRSLLAGRDTCVVMPTGGGKSLCYQLPAVVSGRTAVVVSPLIALMQDQAAQLAQMGIPAAVLNSTLSDQQQSSVVKQAREGAYRLLYLSPERLARGDTIGWLQEVPIAFFAIDEAHCIF